MMINYNFARSRLVYEIRSQLQFTTFGTSTPYSFHIASTIPLLLSLVRARTLTRVTLLDLQKKHIILQPIDRRESEAIGS